jgi:hypothetical protein
MAYTQPDDMPCWTSPGDGWRVATHDEEDAIEAAAGCGGRCFVNDKTGERVLCDASDLVLWSNISPD